MSDYCKRFQFKSENNNYILSLKSIKENNNEKLFIKLTLILLDEIVHFFYENTLEKIKIEQKCLNEFYTINFLIDFLAKLTKQKRITLCRINNFVYKIDFYDKENNRQIEFMLKGKINSNKKSIEELQNEIINMHKIMEKMQNQINEQNSKVKKLEEENKELNNKINEMQSVNNINGDKNSNNIDKSKKDKISKILEINPLGSNKGISDNKKGNNYFIYNGSNPREKLEDNLGNEKESVNESDLSISMFYNDPTNVPSQNNPSINQNIIFHKENNNEIIFKGNPKLINLKEIVDNNEEECEYFTAFNIESSMPIIVWITKKQNNNINIQNWATKVFYKKDNAHNSKIDKLQYFYNENRKENNNYIISFSINDNETLKIWLIDLCSNSGVELILKNIIQKKINLFFMFSNKNYSKDNFLITYSKYNSQKKLIFFKLDNIFNFIENNNESPKETIDSNEVNHLDIFYYKKSNEIFLINCNNNNVNVTREPYTINDKKIFKKSIIHLSAFMKEIEKKLKLFEANCNGVFIWDYDNNSAPIQEIKCGTSFDLCLWNNKFLWSSTNNGFKLFDLENNSEELVIDENKTNTKKRNGSNIRKIYSPSQINGSIVGIDYNRKLCVWSQ